MDIIALGAESTLYRLQHWNRVLAVKWRRKKQYLLPAIDASLRRARTTRECKMLTVVRSLGVRTPAVYSLDLDECSITMDFINGIQLKQFIEREALPEATRFCKEFGDILARLHEAGIVHGDPTTSNLIVDEHSRLWFIDFGLSETNASVEMKGVDIHLVRRALETTHWDVQNELLQSFLEGYKSRSGTDAEPVLARMDEIRERGRYH